MGLRQDVQVSSALPDELADRIEISDGTAVADAICGVKCCPDGYLPAAAWRPPTAGEFALLTSGATRGDLGAVIGHLRVPEAVLAPFSDLRALSAKSSDVGDVETLARSLTTPEALAPVMAYCTCLRAAQRVPFEGVLIKVNAPGLPAVTTMPDGSFVGLHLDSWYRAPLEHRHLSPNRISINLGAGDRFLMFVDLQIKTMVEITPGEHRSESIAADFPARFLRSFPSYPVVRLRVRPGEAYIAPTENVAHEGSSVESGAIDVQLTVRGSFKTPTR